MAVITFDYPCGWYCDYAPNLWCGIRTVSAVWEGQTIAIPAPARLDSSLFVSDMYSIPKLLQWKWPANVGKGNIPAYFHDFTRRFWRIIPGMTPARADAMFLDAMRHPEFDIPAARTFYAAVRLASILCPPPGDGTPPRHVRAAMTAAKDSWAGYTTLVRSVYGLTNTVARDTV